MRSERAWQVGRMLGGVGVFIVLSLLALAALLGLHYTTGTLDVTTLQPWQRPAEGWSEPLTVQRVAGSGSGPVVTVAGSPDRAAVVALADTAEGDRILTVRELDLARGELVGRWRLDLPGSRIAAVGAVAWAPGPGAPALRSGWGLHLALVDRASGSAVVRYVLWEPDRGARLDITLTPPGLTGTDAAIALGPDGRAHLVWSQFDSRGYSIHYAPILRGKGGDPIRLSTPGIRSRSPSLAVTADGTVWVAWLEFEAGGVVQRLMYTRVRPPATPEAAPRPAAPQRIATGTSRVSQPQVVCPTPRAAGCIFVNVSSGAGQSMLGGASEDIFYVDLPPASGGEAAVRRLTRTASYIRGLAAAPASARGAHVAWMDARGNNRDVLYLRLDPSGSPIGGETLLSPSFGGDIKPGLTDADGRPVVVWLAQDADGALLLERDTFRPRPVSQAYRVGLGTAPLVALTFGWAVALFRAALETAVGFIPLVLVGLTSAWIVGRTGVAGGRRLPAALALVTALGTAVTWPGAPWAPYFEVLPPSWTVLHHLGCAAAATLLAGLFAAARRLEVDEWLAGLFISAIWFYWLIYLGVVPQVLQFN